MMKNILAVALLMGGISGFTLAQAEEKSQANILGTDFQRILAGRGPWALETNSYGSAVALRFGIDPGADDHLFQYLNFLSINNQPSEVIGDYGWSVLTRLTVDGSTGRSSVQREDLLQVDFFQRLSAGGDSDQLVDWFLTVTFTNLTAQRMSLCYYPYLDYDLWGSRYGDTARYSGVDLDLGVPSLRVQKDGIPGTFLLADLDSLSTEYRMDFPVTLMALLEGAPCAALENFGDPYGPGDFSGALKIPLTIPAGGFAVVNLRMGRID